MCSDWKTLPSLFHDVEVKLFHREQRGRNRGLKIESDTGIKEDEIVAIIAANGDYEVVCEMVGINGKKPVKLRFHPHILEAGKQNEIIQAAIKRTTVNMVNRFLSAEWTLEAPKAADEVSASEVQSILLSQAFVIEVTDDYRTVITWKVSSEHLKLGSKKLPKGKKAKAMEKLFTKLTKSLAVCVSSLATGQKNGLPKVSSYFEKLTKLSLPPPSQLVDIVFLEDEAPKTLLTLEFAGFPPLDDMTTTSPHQFFFDIKAGTIKLELISKTDVSRNCFWVVPHNVGCLGYTRLTPVTGQLMIDCAHFRVQELPRDLTDSLNEYPKAMVLEPTTDDVKEEAPITIKKKPSTPVEALFLSTSAVAIQVEVSPPRRASLAGRFQITPTVNAPPPTSRKGSDPADIKPLHVDAPSLSVVKNSMVISPSESIDSGVVSPGITSDEDHLKTSSTPRLKLRDRSASECYPTQNIPGLKGILKKPKTVLSSSNVLRRSPATSRMLYARSISECHDGGESTELELDFLAESSDTIASSSPPRCDRGFFRVDEEDESDCSDVVAGALEPRKKRVSFSEHVQARIYRSNSSILGQKKKNERRNRCKRNRTNSSDSESAINGEEDSPYSISPAERMHLEQLARECSSSGSPALRSNRNISTDSAYGDEVDSDETEKRMEELTLA